MMIADLSNEGDEWKGLARSTGGGDAKEDRSNIGLLNQGSVLICTGGIYGQGVR